MIQSLTYEQLPKPQQNNDTTLLWTQFTSLVQHQFAQHQHLIDQLAIPKPSIVIGVFLSLIIFLQFGGHILINLISWAYPAYASFLAIESSSTEDDTQWLIYWTVIGFVRILLYFSDFFFSWSNVYYTCKTLVIFWLVLPQFKGAETVYASMLRPYLLKVQPEIESSIKNISDKFFHSFFN